MMKTETEGMGLCPITPSGPNRVHTKGKKTETTPVMPNRGHLIQGLGHKGMERTRREQRRRRRQEQRKKGEELEIRCERCVHESA